MKTHHVAALVLAGPLAFGIGTVVTASVLRASPPHEHVEVHSYAEVCMSHDPPPPRQVAAECGTAR